MQWAAHDAELNEFVRAQENKYEQEQMDSRYALVDDLKVQQQEHKKKEQDAKLNASFKAGDEFFGAFGQGL